jgi:hypothetical protein
MWWDRDAIDLDFRYWKCHETWYGQGENQFASSQLASRRRYHGYFGIAYTVVHKHVCL